jgi:hypothetical protein
MAQPFHPTRVPYRSRPRRRPRPRGFLGSGLTAWPAADKREIKGPSVALGKSRVVEDSLPDVASWSLERQGEVGRTTTTRTI